MTTNTRNSLRQAAACGWTVVMLASSLWAQSPMRLQVLATSDQAKAQAAVEQLNQLGAGPAEVRQTDNLYKVLTKSYASLAEANFAKPALKGAGFMGCFAVADQAKASSQNSSLEKLPSVLSQVEFDQARFDFKVASPPKRAQRITAQLEALDNQKASEKELFDKAMGYYKKEQAEAAVAAFDAFCQRFPASPQVAQAKLMKAYWLVEKGDAQAAEAQFERVAAEHAGQSEAGEATLRLGYLLLRQEKEAQALSRFYSVAAAKVKASEEVRVEAILRTAALYHRGHDLDAAMQAYDVIAQGATSAEARAFAEMQQAGLLLEKAWNQKASFGQARAKCDQVLERYPQANKAIRATAAVMALETLAYERDFPGMLKREKAFLDEFAQTEESTLAFYWLAKARLETGDAQGAAGILESLMAARFDTSKRFKYVEVNSQARRLAARAYEKLGDKAKAQALLEAR